MTLTLVMSDIPDGLVTHNGLRSLVFRKYEAQVTLVL